MSSLSTLKPFPDKSFPWVELFGTRLQQRYGKKRFAGLIEIAMNESQNLLRFAELGIAPVAGGKRGPTETRAYLECEVAK